MALERRDPLPPGRYWQTILQKEMHGFDEWLQKNKASVRLVRSELQYATSSDSWSVPFLGADAPSIFSVNLSGDMIKSLKAIWVLFDVTAPTPWVGYGFPTIVRANEMQNTRPDEFFQGVSPEDMARERGAGESQLDGLFLKAGLVLAGIVVLNRLLAPKTRAIPGKGATVTARKS